MNSANELFNDRKECHFQLVSMLKISKITDQKILLKKSYKFHQNFIFSMLFQCAWSTLGLANVLLKITVKNSRKMYPLKFLRLILWISVPKIMTPLNKWFNLLYMWIDLYSNIINTLKNISQQSIQTVQNPKIPTTFFIAKVPPPRVLIFPCAWNPEQRDINHLPKKLYRPQQNINKFMFLRQLIKIATPIIPSSFPL